MARRLKLHPSDPLVVNYHGPQLRAFLRKNSIEAKELASLLHVGPSTISGYMNTQIMHPRVRWAISKALKIPQEEIFKTLGLTGEPDDNLIAAEEVLNTPSELPVDYVNSLSSLTLDLQRQLGHISEQVNLLRGSTKDRQILRNGVVELLNQATKLLSQLDHLNP